jgi:hypothetical protein
VGSGVVGSGVVGFGVVGFGVVGFGVVVFVDGGLVVDAFFVVFLVVAVVPGRFVVVAGGRYVVTTGTGCRTPVLVDDVALVVGLVDGVVVSRTVTDGSEPVVASDAEVLGRVAAPATSTAPSGAFPMTLTATTPASAVTRTPVAAPRTGSRR